MIEQRQAAICDNRMLYEMAMDFYLKYHETKYAQNDDPVLRPRLNGRSVSASVTL